MAATQAPSGSPGRASLGEVAHDLRGALAAAGAFLDLAREQLGRGEPLRDEDLERVERALQRVQAELARLDAMAKEARP